MAILVIRLTLSSNLLFEASTSTTPVLAGISLLLAAGLLAGLCTRALALAALPFFTNLCGPASWAGCLLGGQAGFAVALALLGGGALSLDARLFGRRVLRVRG